MIYTCVVTVMPVEDRNQFNASDNSVHVDVDVGITNPEEFCLVVGAEVGRIARRLTKTRRASDVVPA